MNSTSILTLLQIAASLLASVHNNPQASFAAQQQAVALANQAVQQAIQLEVTPNINFPTPKNPSIWPNVVDLRSAAYIGPDGGYVPLSANVVLLDADTSFGDINGDGLDDAAAIIQRTNSVGQTATMLAIMLNQNGAMFNIADVQLGDASMQILSHHVVEGGDIVLNTQSGFAPAQTSTYALVGEQLIKI